MVVVRKSYYINILTHKRNGTLYTGMTGEIDRRIWQHKNGYDSGFSKRYGLHRLVYHERFDTAEAAIRREKQLTAGSWAKKIARIEGMNPGWEDLSDRFLTVSQRTLTLLWIASVFAFSFAGTSRRSSLQ